MTHYRREFFRLVEAGTVGIFLVQAVRFLFTLLYAHVSSASLVALTANPAAITNVPGVVNPADVQIELVAAGIALFVPLLASVLGRAWFGPALAAIVVAAGRVFMSSDAGQIGVIGAAAAAGAGMLYIGTIAVRRSRYVPVAFVIGFALDQLIRLYGATLDPTWDVSFLNIQTGLSVGLLVVAIVAAFLDRASPPDENSDPPGEISGWSAFALAGLMYLEFVIFGLPNTVAHRAGGGIDYLSVAPSLVAATLLPLVPQVRDMARRFLVIFDGPYRGWVWVLLSGLLVVLGFRLQGTAALVPLILAQLLIGLSWWWVVQPSAGRGLFTGPSVVFAVLLFLLLCGGDFFTYEYAFVRSNVPYPLDIVLRAMRGLGLAITLFAVLLSSLPAILARKRLPWLGGNLTESLAALAAVVGAGVLAASLASPTVVKPPDNPGTLRIATLNLHGGYSLYFATNYADTAFNLRQNGADIILLQEVETGRLISGGVDQPAWLARQLGMQVVYFPTNESMQGLALLTRLPVVQAQGVLLTSIGRQTGVQLVRLMTPNGASFDVYNTELGLPLLNSSEQDQDRQIQEIIAYIGQNDANGHLILGGTFNSLPDPDNPIYAYMSQRGFLDPLKDARVESSYTLTLVNGDRHRVDYLWTKNIKVEQAATPPITFSNHNLVVIQVNSGG